MFLLFNNKEKEQKGFTLIEMMVAVSIFVIVAFIVVSTLLTLSYSYKKAQKMRLLMDNLGFSIQSMSLNIREAVDYSQPVACQTSSNNSTCFYFKPLDSWVNKETTKTCFSWYDRGDIPNTHGIKKCNNACPCSDSGLDIISQDIDITNLLFKKVGSGDLQRVQIIISGTAGKTEKERTNFFIQNTVAQRNINN